VESRLRGAAQSLVDQSGSSDAEVRWDWSSPAALDIVSRGFAQWIESPNLRLGGNEEAWPDHLAELARAANQPIGQTDVEKVLAHLVDVALGRRPSADRFCNPNCIPSINVVSTARSE
jgi:hypothetical protein